MAWQGNILLKWMGESAMDGEALERVRREVEAAFALPTRLGLAGRPPAGSRDPRRGQYSSTRILHAILADDPPATDKVLGITDVDLFIPVLTFVFGEAQVGGPAGVVSIARLRRTYDDRQAPEEMIETRLLKECLHELGHTFGLVHCPDQVCVMSRSNSVLDVDRKGTAFCRDCRLRLRTLRKERDGV